MLCFPCIVLVAFHYIQNVVSTMSTLISFTHAIWLLSSGEVMVQVMDTGDKGWWGRVGEVTVNKLSILFSEEVKDCNSIY